MNKMHCEYKKSDCEEIKLFYDDWYSKGYMDEWPADKKNRIFEIIRSLDLPETGEALDYGCGNGVFTGILKLALPKWDVYGVDISSIAVDNAGKRYPDCLFFLPSDTRLNNKRFDFLFSHHVLEHVEDINAAWGEIDRYLKEQGSSLHVLPCGNKGSLEYNLCMSRKDGINADSGNRFVFEDKSHLRRLITQQMNDFAARCNLKLVFDYYSNHFFGALDWITLSSPLFILKMTNPIKAKNKASALKLGFLCVFSFLIKIMRFPANTIDHKKKIMKKHEYYFLFFALLVFYPLSKFTNICLKSMSDSEWERRKTDKNGSEMFLYYKRARILHQRS